MGFVGLRDGEFSLLWLEIVLAELAAAAGRIGLLIVACRDVDASGSAVRDTTLLPGD